MIEICLDMIVVMRYMDVCKYMHNGLLSMHDMIHEWRMTDIVETWHVK